MSRALVRTELLSAYAWLPTLGRQLTTPPTIMHTQMRPSLENPTLPWRRDVSGSPFLLTGRCMTNLGSSQYWKDEASPEVKDNVERLCRGIMGADVHRALSADMFSTLLSRFSTNDYTVIGTWDPCGVVQAAAVRLKLPSMCFLGFPSKAKISAEEIPDSPFLGGLTTHLLPP